MRSRTAAAGIARRDHDSPTRRAVLDEVTLEQWSSMDRWVVRGYRSIRRFLSRGRQDWLQITCVCVCSRTRNISRWPDKLRASSCRAFPLVVGQCRSALTRLRIRPEGRRTGACAACAARRCALLSSTLGHRQDATRSARSARLAHIVLSQTCLGTQLSTLPRFARNLAASPCEVPTS
jgi:hypothetical protein